MYNTKLLKTTMMYILENLPAEDRTPARISHTRYFTQTISLQRHRIRIPSRRRNSRTVQAKRNHLRIESAIGIRIRRALREAILLRVQLARLRLRIPRVRGRVGLDGRSAARDRACEFGEGRFEGAEGGGADVEDGAEFGDEVAVDGFLDRACDAVDGGSAVGATAAELGEGEATGEGAGGAGVCAEEKRLAWKVVS